MKTSAIQQLESSPTPKQGRELTEVPDEVQEQMQEQIPSAGNLFLHLFPRLFLRYWGDAGP